ncbi:ABC transporter ATP-binding protein [Geminicoccus roseus]|uniref:ABC transporter ATP-binding protein n=1 Tax=Geminicoccus roseus TaxID=404900 RepID=UPI0003FC23ED|nr:ABC transporter ATP-binding protein [Geminicoccus roseus]
MAFIEISRLTKRFGAYTAVNDVSLAVEEQKFVTLLGPSGCGKTTTLRLLAGFLEPDEGTIAVGGRILSQARDIVLPENRRMGMVFQNYAVWPHLSLFDNVAFGLQLKKLARREIDERVRQVLSVVGLEGLEDRFPSELSGGQQQRVALARSLVVEPSILLLDEPLSNLDAKLREHMRTELKALQRRTAITFVYVTHDQAEAMALSDMVAVFNRGELQQLGTPREIYDRPANLFVADFMGSTNMLEGKVAEHGPDGLLVQAGRLTLRAQPGPRVNPSGRVTLVVRPEAVRLGEDAVRDAAPGAADGAANRFEATITDATFLGNLVEYVVDIAGTTLKAQCQPHLHHPVGSIVPLSIPVAACTAMATETPA